MPEKNYQELGDVTLRAAIDAAKLFIARLEAQIDNARKESAIWQNDLAMLEAEKVRRGFAQGGYTKGDNDVTRTG